MSEWITNSLSVVYQLILNTHFLINNMCSIFYLIYLGPNNETRFRKRSKIS